MNKQYITFTRAMELSGLPSVILNRLIDRGELESVEIAGATLVEAHGLDQHIVRLREQTKKTEKRGTGVTAGRTTERTSLKDGDSNGSR